MLYESDGYLECLTGFFKYVIVVGQKGIDPSECFYQEILMNSLKASLVDMFSPKVQKYVECEVVCLKDELQSDRTLRHYTRRRNPTTAAWRRRRRWYAMQSPALRWRRRRRRAGRITKVCHAENFLECSFDPWLRSYSQEGKHL